MSRKYFYIAAAVVVILVAAASAASMKKQSAPLFSDRSHRTAVLAGTPVDVEVVSMDASRQEGLSGRTSLPQGQGMLFVFDSDSMWGFWMKDMNLAIDIVWLNAQGSVVTVASNIAPDTYPEIFYPSAPARYVIELPAGWAAAHNLAEGQQVVI
ncbi:MAG: DUF192 domain-containing protein [Patescibacteria group bacterium]|nr:DUF192 domain-containing protein [Patescibacteria group bacterium]